MRVRPLLVLATPVLVVAALAGCAGLFGGPASTPSPTGTPTASAPPTIAPGVDVIPTAAPELRPGGTAAQNKQYWDFKLNEYRQLVGIGSSDIMRSHLSTAGFDMSTVEITPDTTAIGLAVDSIEVAARFGDECLIGTVRADRTSSAIAPVLGTGRCLVGSFPVG